MRLDKSCHSHPFVLAVTLRVVRATLLQVRVWDVADILSNNEGVQCQEEASGVAKWNLAGTQATAANILELFTWSFLLFEGEDLS